MVIVNGSRNKMRIFTSYSEKDHSPNDESTVEFINFRKPFDRSTAGIQENHGRGGGGHVRFQSNKLKYCWDKNFFFYLIERKLRMKPALIIRRTLFMTMSQKGHHKVITIIFISPLAAKK